VTENGGGAPRVDAPVALLTLGHEICFPMVRRQREKHAPDATEKEDAMTTATLIDDSVMARLIALALDKIQRKRQPLPKKGRLHRV
jgi:hypothetical protein